MEHDGSDEPAASVGVPEQTRSVRSMGRRAWTAVTVVSIVVAVGAAATALMARGDVAEARDEVVRTRARLRDVESSLAVARADAGKAQDALAEQHTARVAAGEIAVALFSYDHANFDASVARIHERSTAEFMEGFRPLLDRRRRSAADRRETSTARATRVYVAEIIARSARAIVTLNIHEVIDGKSTYSDHPIEVFLVQDAQRWLLRTFAAVAAGDPPVPG